jgi:hypothetical protein
MTSRLFVHLSGLTLQMGQRALVITGGLRKESKLKLIEQRFGVQVDWHEIDSDSSRAVDAIVNRLRSGRVGAVVLLNGLMAHKVANRITQACNQYGVPFATADRGGTGCIERAFGELERRLAT